MSVGSLATLVTMLQAAPTMVGATVQFGEESLNNQEPVLPVVTVVPTEDTYGPTGAPGYYQASDTNINNIWMISPSNIDLYLWNRSLDPLAQPIDHADSVEEFRAQVLQALQSQAPNGLKFYPIRGRWILMQGANIRMGRVYKLTVAVDITIPDVLPIYRKPPITPIIDNAFFIAKSKYENTVLLDHPISFYRLNDPTGSMGPADSSTSALLTGTWIHEELISSRPSILPGAAGDEACCYAASTLAQFDVDHSQNAPGVTVFSFEWWIVPNVFGLDFNSVGPGAGMWLCEGKSGGDVIIGTNGDGTLMHLSAFYTINQLHHCVYTYDGTVGRIYRNGVLVAFQPQSTPFYSGSPASWGPCSDGNWFASFQNLALYDSVLSPAQITTHYNVGMGA